MAQENVEVTKQSVEEIPARHEYTVTAESGLFKNGKQYDKGDTVQLDEQTASRFKEAGEVE